MGPDTKAFNPTPTILDWIPYSHAHHHCSSNDSRPTPPTASLTIPTTVTTATYTTKIFITFITNTKPRHVFPTSTTTSSILFTIIHTAPLPSPPLLTPARLSAIVLTQTNATSPSLSLPD
ncbi:hypothetical protein E2C01_009227 [Portunus trituberculatus]|uniref:Uncharacterized protein n=1 Tax=Portunus trituberculatus TaxID=210409 RepID=A0A5B7D5Q7_PORTR|nr:hypothetical protein [Portunus trituberculatus]